jgi:hypothetical protein
MSDPSGSGRLVALSVKDVPELEMGILLFIPDYNAKGADRTYKSLRFQYNPETITRTRQGEWTTDKAKTGQKVLQDTTLLDGHRGGGLLAKSETVSFKLVFDATDLMMKGKGDATANVLPELAFLEQVALGGDEPMKTEATTGGTAKPPTPGMKATKPAGTQDDTSKSSAGKPPAGQPAGSKGAAGKTPQKATIQSTAPSELVLVLQERTFPVVLTSLTIVEQRFNHRFEPIRAECDCKFRVLETQEVKNNKPAQVAFTELLKKRQEWATKAAVAAGDERVQRIVKALEGGTKP